MNTHSHTYTEIFVNLLKTNGMINTPENDKKKTKNDCQHME